MFVSPFLLNLNLPVKKETQNIALSQWHYYEHWWSFQSTINVCEDHSVMSDCLWPQGLYSPWNFLGQNNGVGSLSLLQGIFLTQGLNPGLPHCRRIFYQLSHQGSPRILNPADLPDPGIKLGSPALQADSLSTELLGKPHKCILWCICKSVMDGANHLLAVEMILAFYFSKYKL